MRELSRLNMEDIIYEREKGLIKHCSHVGRSEARDKLDKNKEFRIHHHLFSAAYPQVQRVMDSFGI